MKKVLALLSVLAFAAATAMASETHTNSTWETTIGAGLTVTRGNSDTLMANLNAVSTKKWKENELMLGGDGTYGETDGLKTAESIRGYVQYNRLFTERLFGYMRVEGLRDEIAAIDYRFTFSPGAGYYLIKQTNTFLRAEVGPGYIVQKQGGVTDDYFTLRLAERFEQKLNDKAKLWESLEYLPQVDDWKNYILNGEIGIEVMINKSFSLRTFLQDTFNNEPAPGRKQNDVKLVAGVGYKF